MNEFGTVTRLLDAVAAGDKQAESRLMQAMYEDLRVAARGLIRSERNGHTLEPTGLVHEAILRLLASQGFQKADSRGKLLAMAIRTMRQVLVDHARRRNAAKRGGGWERSSLDVIVDAYEAECTDLEGLDAALEMLTRLSPRQSEIIQLRFFAGLSIHKIAEEMQLSTSSIEKELLKARAFLHSHVCHE